MLFQFKQFNVQQQEEVFKIGTDALLLGAWAEVGPAGKVLDIGTGTGIIALMLAQRSHAHIDAVEINGKSADVAAQNFAASPWKDRLCIYEKSLQNFSAERAGEYDLVVSNPPFFNRSLPSASKAKSLAKHTAELSHHDLLLHSSKLLNEKGRLALILPVEEGRQLISNAKFCELFLSRTTEVHPTKSKAANRLLIELGRDERDFEESKFFIREASGGFTKQYVELTQEYHTIF